VIGMLAVGGLYLAHMLFARPEVLEQEPGRD
jgi:hypothetical protein